jgi:hypothetical protein
MVLRQHPCVNGLFMERYHGGHCRSGFFTPRVDCSLCFFVAIDGRSVEEAYAHSGKHGKFGVSTLNEG